MREKTSVSSTFSELREKTFRVACNTLNEIFFVFGADTEKETRARLIRFVHTGQTEDPV